MNTTRERERMTDQNEYNRRLIEEFRANRAAGGQAMTGRPLLLLTTTGAKSGLPRTTPLMYIPDGDRLLVLASNAGAPKDPDWYRNLIRHPRVTVEVGDETYDADAVAVEGEERARLWSDLVQRYPFFADHQAQVTREIPVVALKRIAR